MERRGDAGGENASVIVEYFSSIPHVSVSMNRENPTARAW
jgi:hypothetical protein